MGACASKPKDLDNENVPAPVEAPPVPAEIPVDTEKVEAGTVAQEVKDRDENKEKPSVDASESEPAPEAPKTEEATTEEKPATEKAVPAEVEPTEAKAEALEEVKELQKEEKKEEAETVATSQNLAIVKTEDNKLCTTS